MKIAIFVTVTLLLVLLNIRKGQAELDSEEYDEYGNQELTYEDDSPEQQDIQIQDEEFRDSRGLFKKKKKKKVKISFGGDDDDDSDEEIKCKTNGDCNFYKYCSTQGICLNYVGRKRRQVLHHS